LLYFVAADINLPLNFGTEILLFDPFVLDLRWYVGGRLAVLFSKDVQS